MNDFLAHQVRKEFLQQEMKNISKLRLEYSLAS